MKLETERLILRNARPEDADEFYEIRNSPYVLQYNPMGSLSRERLAKQLEKDAVSEKALYLERKEDKRVIGAIYFSEDDLRYRMESLTLAYYLGEPYANRGYMTEALDRALEYAFKDLAVPLVAARVFSDNTASLRVLEKLGFRQEGKLRQAVRDLNDAVHDDVLFSLLCQEYEQRKNGK